MDKVKEVLLAVWESPKVRAAAKALLLVTVGVLAEKLGLGAMLGL
jgi:hypothetical protein